MAKMIDREFWGNKKVFVTGHTGFKGSWLSAWLSNLGAGVSGFSLPPSKENEMFTTCRLDRRMESSYGDIRDMSILENALRLAEPAIVFHLAAQPLVRKSYEDPLSTFSTNVLGTANVLEAVRTTPSVKAVIVVTSDKCYENTDKPTGYGEEDSMGGHDPYSASKGCAELVTASYRRSFFQKGNSVGVATVRAGNVIGGGDYSEGRIIPDAIRAFQRRQPLSVRNPASVRPWQHVLEPLAGYLMLAEKIHRSGPEWAGGWNFGPSSRGDATVAELINIVIQHWPGGSWQACPDEQELHEARTLRLISDKARDRLGWEPMLSLNEAVAMSADWYKAAVADDAQMYEFTLKQIRTYEALIKNRRLGGDREQ